jgi:hypothetical protein
VMHGSDREEGRGQGAKRRNEQDRENYGRPSPRTASAQKHAQYRKSHNDDRIEVPASPKLFRKRWLSAIDAKHLRPCMALAHRLGRAPTITCRNSAPFRSVPSDRQLPAPWPCLGDSAFWDRSVPHEARSGGRRRGLALGHSCSVDGADRPRIVWKFG